MSKRQDSGTIKIFKYSKRDKKSFPFVYLMLLLPVLHILSFYFYVNFSSFAMAFQDVDGDWSLQSLERVIQGFVENVDKSGSVFKPREMLFKSMFLWFILNVVCWVFGTFSVFILTKHMFCGKVNRVIYFIPGIVGAVVFSQVMRELYSVNGPLIQILRTLEVELDPFAFKNGLLGAEQTAYATMVIQAFIFAITGSNMVVAGAFMRIPNEIFESAQLEGCGILREAFQIAIPCAWPTISTLIVFSLCTFYTCDYNFYLYSAGTGAYGLTSVNFYLYQFQVRISTMTDTKYLHGYVSAFGMVITLMTIPVVLLGRWILGKINADVDY